MPIIRNTCTPTPAPGTAADLADFIAAGEAQAVNDATSPTGIAWHQPGVYCGVPAAAVWHFDSTADDAHDLPWHDDDCIVAIEIGAPIAKGQALRDPAAIRAAAQALLAVSDDAEALASADHDCEDTCAWDVVRSLAIGAPPIALTDRVIIRAHGLQQVLIYA